MKLFSFYNKSVFVQYRNQLCSTTTVAVCLLSLAAFVIPASVLFSVQRGKLWDQHHLVYEQPKVKFSYKYLFLAELEGGGDRESSIVTCSSFESYNSATEELPSCNGIHVTPFDEDHDQMLDHLKVAINFNPPEETNRLQFYTLYFFLEATVSSQCSFTVPTFVYLDKVPAPWPKFQSGKIEHRGSLEVKQSASLQCPFFMRHQKSHFSDRYYPNENTTLDEFQPSIIAEKIESSNPTYFAFDATQHTWELDDSGTINIVLFVSIGGPDSRKTALLYTTSLWQRMHQFWTGYFPLLLVCLWIADKLKMYLFEKFYLRAVEVLPWKEKYK
ncbi:transmembrane protein 231 [Anopheles bellator]|uniref:transmembrane protein 231 n=1 Tax=Anopheles bellator TaxID=139047 RepID=UPI002648A607|nr:transmembrane protein 231 [Anopheles bellator]